MLFIKKKLFLMEKREQWKFSIILTKIDKISNNYLEYQKKSILSLMENYEKSFTKIYQSETKKNNGITEIQRSIYGLSQ